MDQFKVGDCVVTLEGTGFVTEIGQETLHVSLDGREVFWFFPHEVRSLE